MIKPPLLILVIAMMVIGCTTPRDLYTWQGAPADDLINAWGPPDRVSILPDGHKVIRYTHDAGRYGRAECDIEWWANTKGIVDKFRWRGKAEICKRMLLSRAQGPNKTSEILWRRNYQFN